MEGPPLCLVVRVSGYRSRGSGFDFWRNQILREVVGLERGALSPVSVSKRILEWKISDPQSRNP
jgi:hypothetical protein